MSNQELALMIQAGDQDQLPVLWEQVKRLCSIIERRYYEMSKSNIAVDMEDLDQESYLGMVEAVERFKPEMGSFNSILDLCIRRHCRVALGLQGRVKWEHYYKDSMDEPGKGEDPRPLKDKLEDDQLPGMTDDMELAELQRDVREAVAKLPRAEGEIVRDHYLEGTSIREIADERGVTVGRIQQRKLDALERLRADQRMKEYAEISFHRHKGVKGFRSSGSSVVEDAVLRLEAIRERQQAQMEKILREAREEMIAYAWGKPSPARAPLTSSSVGEGIPG